MDRGPDQQRGGCDEERQPIELHDFLANVPDDPS
jgi:hypothetical protein